MVLSMTAFARTETDEFIWELRSVNHRFLEPSFRLPDTFRDLEHVLREQVKKRLKRGKLDATLTVVKTADALSFEINRPVLLHLLATLEQIRRDAPEIGHPDPLDLLRWPGVIRDFAGDDTQDDSDRTGRGGSKARAMAQFDETLATLIAHRSREGAQLDALLQAKLTEVDTTVHHLKGLTGEMTAALRTKLKRRLDDLAANVDPTRLEQEVALLAQRADVVEELDRLRIHVEECRNCLGGRGPHGRRLDFLMQELNREANTLAAKSVSPDSSQRAVDLKVLIEQMREQVQNVE